MIKNKNHKIIILLIKNKKTSLNPKFLKTKQINLFPISKTLLTITLTKIIVKIFNLH